MIRVGQIYANRIYHVYIHFLFSDFCKKWGVYKNKYEEL